MRNVINLNENWAFIQENAGLPKEMPSDWQRIDLPHTWNAVDGHDGNGSYDRGTYWYAKTFETPKQPLGNGKVYVEILAAGQQATVYVNGKEMTYHEGGYSTFRVDITDVCNEEGDNLLVIACSNELKDSVYPQSADFTFYGGLYRGVNLISVPDVHFDLEYYGGPGIQVTPRPCECGGAEFEIVSYVKGADENFTVLYSVCDAEGNEVASACRPADETAVKVYVPDATLWEIDAPTNLWKMEDAQKLLKCYNVVDYVTMPDPGQVWAYIGGWLYQAHLKEIKDNVPEQSRNYYNSCALRMSIALSSFGKDLKGEAGAELIGDKANADTIGGKTHVITRARDMAAYVQKLLGDPDYPDAQDKGYCSPQPGDIIVFAGNGHVGMCPGDNIFIGSFLTGPIWLINRSTLKDAE